MNVKYHITNKCPDCGKLHSADVKENPPIISVKCEICGKFHPQESYTFIAISGDISIGKKNGIIAGNVEDGVVKNVSIFCKGECFAEACKEALEKNITTIGDEDEDFDAIYNGNSDPIVQKKRTPPASNDNTGGF